MQSSSLVLEADGTLETRQLEIPSLSAGDVLLQIERVGICGSDVHMWQHDIGVDYPVVPGHEFVGTVIDMGSESVSDTAGQPVDRGDAVTVVPGINCGECWYCQHMPTRPLTCANRDVHGFRSVTDPPYIHGGMGEYVLVEDRAMWYRLPESIPIALGTLIEPLSVATHAIERAMPPGLPNVREGFGLGRSVAIQGAGPIGLLTAATASASGAGQIIVTDVREDRLAMAEQFGATSTIDVSDQSDDEVVAAIADVSPSGDGPDVVIEAVGKPEAFEQALHIPHNGGTVIEVGHYFPAGDATIDPSALVHRQLDVYGSLAYPPSQFSTSISLLAATLDRFPYGDLLNYEVELSEAVSAFEAQANGTSYRATIQP